MKKLIVFILILFGYSNIYSQKERIDLPCATDALHYELMKTKASYKERFEKDNSQWQEHAKKGSGENLQRSVPLTGPVTLTVAFHNMTNNSVAVVDYDQAISNLDAVFNLHNIDFCRAYQDINGNSFNNNFNGPTNLANNQSAINTFINSVGVINEFPTERYINVYILDAIIPSSVAGFAYLPSAHGESFDGIYIRRDALFSETLTHEMGHYLGLHHVFGICSPDNIDSLNEYDENGNLVYNPCSCNNNNCLFNGDMICDTPPSMLNMSTCIGNTCNTDSNPNFSDGSHPNSDIPDDKQNFMDYSSCRNHFTSGQFLKMQFAVDPDFGIRKSLLQTQSCSNCPNMNSCSIEIDSFDNNSITLDTSGSATVNFTSTLNCTGTVPPIVSETWLLTNLDTNSPIASNNTLSEYSLTVIGNYSIKVTTTFSIDPLCIKVSTYNFQVVPAFDSSANCSIQMPINDWANWNRVSYLHGWNRENTYPYNLSFSGSERYIPTDLNFDTNGFDIITSANLPISEPNFSNIPLPFDTSNNPLPTIRVGRVIDVNNAGGLNPGDAYYTTYTFIPTPENCKFKVHYLGMAEFSQAPINFNNSVLVNSNDSSFGFYSQYQFDSNLSNSTQNAFFGNSEVGGLDYTSTNVNPIEFSSQERTTSFFPNGFNELIYGLTNSMSSGQFVTNNGYTKTVGWQTVDLDYSEFVNSNIEVTLTFFARSNTGLDGNANKHSYGYFAVECLGGGNPKHLDIDFPDIQIPCSHPNAGTSCHTETFTLPIENRIPHYYGLVNQPNQPNNIVNLTVTNLTGSGNTVEGIFNYEEQRFEFKICLTSSNVPFEDYQVTFETLNQTITDTIRVFYGYYYSICETDKGGNYTQNTSKELIYCPNTGQSATFNLTNPCSFNGLIPIPTPTLIPSNNPTGPSGNNEFYYQWIVLKDGVPVSNFPYDDAQSSNFNQFVINNATIPFINNNCSYEIYRRFYRRDIYCGGYMQFDSPSFYLYPLITAPNFSVDQVNICANEDEVNVHFTGVDVRNCIPQSILDQYLTNNGINNNWTLSFVILGPNGQELSYFDATDQLIVEPIEISASTNYLIFDHTFIFNNVDTTTNTFIYKAGTKNLFVKWHLTRYGCNPLSFVGESNVIINVEPSAEGGQIKFNPNPPSGIECPIFSFINDGTTIPANNGFDWQYSSDNPITASSIWVNFPFNIHSSNFSAYLGGLNLSPILHIRRVSKGIATTAGCEAPAVSNILEINPLGLPYFNEVKTICHNQQLPTLPTITLYNNIHGTWSNWEEGTDLVTGYTTYTSIFTVDTNYLLCVPPDYNNENNNNKIKHTVMILPERHPDCDCLSDLVLIGTDNSSGIGFAYEFFRNNTIVAEHGYEVHGEDNIEMHTGDYIDLLPDTMFRTTHHFMAYIEGCPTVPEQKASDINNNNGINISKQLVVFPNPTNGEITIMMKNAKFNNVTISTIDGKIIYRKTLDKTAEFKFNLDTYPQSIYIISVIDENGDNFFEKIIKN